MNNCYSEKAGLKTSVSGHWPDLLLGDSLTIGYVWNKVNYNTNSKSNDER